MRPEASVVRRVRIVVGIGMLMVDAVRGDPEDRSPFERQRPADRKKYSSALGTLYERCVCSR